jgi:hypothetical protein
MTDISKASADAIEAAKQGDQYAAILAALQTAALVQQLQQPPPAPAPVPQPAGGAGKWIGLGVGGSIFLMTLAVCAVAVAVAAVAVALVGIVVYGIYRDIRKR